MKKTLIFLLAFAMVLTSYSEALAHRKRSKIRGPFGSWTWGPDIPHIHNYGDAPSKIPPQPPSTNPTPTPQVGKKFHLENTCHETLRLVLRYKKTNGEWTTQGWWTFSPGELAELVGVRSQNSIFYYYAHIPGADYSWSGSEQRSFEGRNYPMRKQDLKVNAEGNWSLVLNCDNR